MSRVIYISYDGMLEPLGQSQVLRYLERLAVEHEIFLISFEKAEDWEKVREREALQTSIGQAGISWIPLKYHKYPTALATAYDIFQGTTVAAWLVVSKRIQIVHARSYVASVMALILKRLLGTKFIFDMRGFWADERIDGGIWPSGSRLYRVAKWFERRFLLTADVVVSLTQAGVDAMRNWEFLKAKTPRFEVITTCADLGLFHPGKALSGINDRPFTVGYVGSVGVWYLFDEALVCFKAIKAQRPDACLHILNRGAHDFILERLAAHQIDLSCVRLEATDHAGVVAAMQQMNAGVFFIKPVFSKQASAPTKLGEFLGCGVPCLGNHGVGDMATIIEQEEVGVAVRSFDQESIGKAAMSLLALAASPTIRERCRHVALRRFSLDEGAEAYGRIYCSLAV